MNTCIVYPTSREYWFNDRLIRMRPYRPLEQPVHLDPPSGEGWNRFARACECVDLHLPLHVLVTERKDYRRPNATRRVHVRNTFRELDAYGQIGQSLYVESPEMLFVSAALSLSLIALTHLGCELCGSFGFDSSQLGGVTHREPITNPGNLREFVKSHTYVRGSERALQTLELGYVIAGARSPLEITLMLLLCLPPRYGGYGLPLPVLNGQIDVSGGARKAVGKQFYVGDLVWGKGKGLIVEYDSKAAHEDRYDRDKKRVGDLNYLHYDVVSVSPGMLYSLEEMEHVALRCAQVLRKQLKAEYLGAIPSRIKLRNELLGKSASYAETGYQL